MKLYVLLSLILLASCNPELQKVGESPNDLVKYFKLTPTGTNALGEGVLIIAHAGDKRILTYYLKRASNKYSHTDVTISTLNGFHLDSVYSKTEACKIQPDYDQPDFYNYLNVGGEQKGYKLEILPREDAMKMLGDLSC